MEQLINEIRTEFQIPPYFRNEGIANYINEGKARLDMLKPGSDFEDDLTCRSLLKNYVYYAYHHKVDEWERNYLQILLSWQMGSEVQK